jgi:hypothetical protein
MERTTPTTPTTTHAPDAQERQPDAPVRTPHLGGLSNTGLTSWSIRVLAQYPWRRASLAVSRMIGRTRRAADRPWMRPARVPVLLVAVALLLVWLAHTRLLSSWLADQRAWLTPWRALAAVGVLLLVGGIPRARTRMVVGNFVDSTGAKAQLCPGLGSLLVVELARLARVCQAVDGKRVRPRVQAPQELHFEVDKSLDEVANDPSLTMSMLPIQASLQVGEDNQVLRNAVAVDTKVSAGGITIPIGAIVNLFTVLAQGPRLSGELHRVDGKLTLTARLIVGGQLRTWRVDTDDTPSSHFSPFGSLPTWPSRVPVVGARSMPCLKGLQPTEVALAP